jgi:hypothetical protein
MQTIRPLPSAGLPSGKLRQFIYCPLAVLVRWDGVVPMEGLGILEG